MRSYTNIILHAIAYTAIACSAALPVTVGHAQAPAHRTPSVDQSTVAAKTDFDTVTAADPATKTALDAKDLAGAGKLIGKDGSFQGTVTSVYKGRGIVILDFDKNYRSALVAVVKSDSYAKFPPLDKLVGKHVVISAKFINYEGRTEVEMSDAHQVKVIK